jgi:hypothetical protein
MCGECNWPINIKDKNTKKIISSDIPSNKKEILGYARDPMSHLREDVSKEMPQSQKMP